MTEPLTLRFPPSPASWVIHPPTDPYGDGYVARVLMEIHDSGLDAYIDTTLSIPPADGGWDLALFVQGLADDWQGWSGERSWRSMGGEVFINARHDGRRQVTLAITLQGDPVTDGWTARTLLEVEAGE